MKLDETHEYRDYVELQGLASKYFYVPRTLIRNTELGDKRISIFTYVSMYRGLNSKMIFSISHFLEWAQYKNDIHKGGMNDKIITTLYMLSDEGYLTFYDVFKSKKGSVHIELNTDIIFDNCKDDGYGVIYCDEVEKIMNYSKETNKNRYFNCNTVLMVFVFLRDAIYRVSNKLKPEERSSEMLQARRKRCPEAYNESYKDIALELGISERSVAEAVNILEDLGLIVYEEAYHFKNEDDEYRTPDTIFVNAYKREDNKLLTFDDSYAKEQILNKEEQMKKYFIGYTLKKKKPLFEKVG